MKRKIFSKLLMGAFLIASVSMFVSCKDYDDDISKNSQEITALKGQLESLKSSLSSELSSAKSQLEAAIANKADKSALDSKADASDVLDLAARVAALETQIKAIDECATKSDLDEVKATLAALTGELDKAATADDIAAAIEAQNKIQAEALEAFKKEIEAKGYVTGDELAKLKERIDALEDKLGKIDVNAAIDELQKKSQEVLDSILKDVDAEIATMKLLVTAKLTSVVLKPDFYWEGIEGIEVPILSTPKLVPIENYEFSYKVNEAPLGDQIVKVVVDEVMSLPVTDPTGTYTNFILETFDGTEKLNGKGGAADKWGAYYAYNYWNVLSGDDKPDEDNLESIDYDDLQTIAEGWVKNGKKGSLVYKNIQKPGLANYHINPVMANIEGAKIEFYTNLAEVYTRSGDTDIQFKPIVDNYTEAGENDDDPYHTNIFDKGILTIPFEVNNYNKLKTYFTNWSEKNYTKTFEGYEPTWTKTDAEDKADAHNDDNAYGSTPTYDKAGEIVANSNKTAPLPFLAVQLTTYNKDGAVDTVVTSDYAVVVPAEVKIIALADKNPNEKLDEESFIKKHNGKIRTNHLYETVGYTNTGDNEEDQGSYGAIPMPATHSVAWNDTIDISQFIETHANYVTYTRYGQSVQDKALTPAELIALGLHYEYKAIGYTVGKNKTSESMHIRQIDGTETGSRSGLFTPVAVEVQEDGSGKPYADNHQSRNTIDREPLIRVDLVDSDGDIVRYGYIKLRIVDTEQANMEVTVNFPEVYMDCGFEVKMTWAQVEDLILHRLGENGFTKQEFEKAYYLDVEGFAGDEAGNSWEVMPATKEQTYTKKSGTVTAPSGKLEDDWEAADLKARWWAKRFYKGKDGNYYPAISKKTEGAAYGYALDDDGEEIEITDNSGEPFSASNNWFGRVWYTPHDNSTDTHAWDESTNVLRWIVNTDKDKSSNMNKARIENMRTALGVDYKNPNKSTKALSTVVRFVNKVTGAYIYVTLNIPVVYFNYGEVANKDWSHWFKFNGGYWYGGYGDHSGLEGASSTKAPFWEEFDTHVNPYKPSNVNYVYLQTNDLNQRLTDFWLDPSNMVVMHGGDNFAMFKADGKKEDGVLKSKVPTITFVFTYPEDSLNSDGTTAAKKTLGENKYKDAAGNEHVIGEKKDVLVWDVKGASGTTWSLTLRDHEDITKAGNTAIVAIGKNNKAWGPEEVAYVDNKDAKGNTVTVANANNVVIHYHGLEAKGVANLYPAATDLINKSGAYNEKGDERFTRGSGLAGISQATYLEKNIDETFTAYIKLDVEHGCYDPFVSKQYFNVRFYRPINVAGLEIEWYDRVLADNTLDIKDLVEVVDWNDFAVVPFGAAAVKERNTVFGIERPKYADVYNNATSMKATNAGIPFEYYGIKELAVRYDEIRTDHAKEVGVRSEVYYTEQDIIDNTDLVKKLPSLSSDREAPANYKTLTLLNANGSIVDFDAVHAWAHSDLNASGNGTKFGRIYYNNDAGTVQLFHIYVPIAVKYNWGNIAWDDTLNDQPGEKLDNDYTQKVWAVITVNATHKK